MANISKLIVFDADGVLLDNQQGGLNDILRLLGKEKEVAAIHEEYKRRKHLGPWGLEESVALYRGYGRDQLLKLAREYCQACLMPGADETARTLKKAGWRVVSISSNPDFIMEALTNILSLDLAYGLELEYNKGVATGRIAAKMDRYAKAVALERMIKTEGIAREQTVAVGDSVTDLPIAEKVGFFIAFNAAPEVANKAKVVIKEKNLTKIIPYLCPLN